MDVIEDFLKADSKPEILDILVRHCAELGFDHSVYIPLTIGAGAETLFPDESKILARQELVARNTLANCPPSWLHRYQEARHAEKDPIVGFVSRSILPVSWQDISLAHPGNIVFDEAREHGLADGVTVTVYGHGGQRVLFSASSERPLKQSSAQKLATAGLVQLTANYVCEALHRIGSRDDGAAIPALSVRETDCLQWAAVGKTSWEIAQILAISERTVVFHLSNAARKLGASNRRQAVVRALSMRLINP